MWFWFSIATLIFWSGSDLFSKIGCREANDKVSHLKMVAAVGVVMGLHAAYSVFIADVPITLDVIITYLPVSFLYIFSMLLGYVGLRYIELSISSPICNTSGVLVSIATVIRVGIGDFDPMQLFAVGMTAIGVLLLGITEATEDVELRAERQKASNRRYAKSALALILPIAYCIFDAAGTYADSIVLEKLNEESANVAYELTFFAVGLICLIYILIFKRDTLSVKRETPKFIGAAFETAGQLFYVYALADTSHVAFAAPIISSYCAVSVLWSRIFLKEKLSAKHYVSLVVILLGIVIMGVFDA